MSTDGGAGRAGGPLLLGKDEDMLDASEGARAELSSDPNDPTENSDTVGDLAALSK